MGFNYTWKTQDYFDMEPGIRQGLMMRAAGQREREFDAHRSDVLEAQKQAAVDRANADRQREQAKMDALGEATGRLHGSEGIGEPPPELLQNPAYVRGFMIGAKERQIQQQAAEIQKQRDAASAERAQIGAAGRIAAINAKKEDDAPPDLGAQEDAAYEGALSDLGRFASQGIAIDVERDKRGFPRIEKDSNYWSDANDPASTEAQLQKIKDEWEAARRRRGVAPQSGSRTGSLPVLRYPAK